MRVRTDLLQRFLIRGHHLLVIAHLFLVVSELYFDHIVSKWKLDLVFWLHFSASFLARFMLTVFRYELLTATFIIVIGVYLDNVDIDYLWGRLGLAPFVSCLILVLLLCLQVCGLQLLRLLSNIVIIISPFYLYMNR